MVYSPLLFAGSLMIVGCFLRYPSCVLGFPTSVLPASLTRSKTNHRIQPFDNVVSSLILFISPEKSRGNKSRRNFLSKASGAALFGLTRPLACRAIVTGPEDGLLPDLPPEAVRSYLQYRVNLQVAADYYFFELEEKVEDPQQWGEVSQLFNTANGRGGQGQPSKVERDFVNPMRIVGLSMPPETAETLRDAQYDFERAMQIVSKTTAVFRRDLSVELDGSLITKAREGWEAGRVALNSYFAALNDAVGLQELRLIPADGPNRYREYGRSPRRFLDLEKKTKLCQNRGGPTLSQTWGQLMVSGYLQDSCGIPDMVDYFYQ